MTSNICRLLQLPVHGVRALGTAAVDMCQVATGGADVYYHVGMHCWDIAASAIIVQEAGGVVMDTDGGCRVSAVHGCVLLFRLLPFRRDVTASHRSQLARRGQSNRLCLSSLSL